MSSRTKRVQKTKITNPKYAKTKLPKPRNSVGWVASDAVQRNRVSPLRSITESEHVHITNKRPVERELPTRKSGAGPAWSG